MSDAGEPSTERHDENVARHCFSVIRIAHFEAMFRTAGPNSNGELAIDKLGTVFRLAGMPLTSKRTSDYAESINKDKFRFGDFLDLLSVHATRREELAARIEHERRSKVLRGPAAHDDFDLLKSDFPSVMEPGDWVDMLLTIFCCLDRRGSGTVDVRDVKHLLCERFAESDLLSSSEFSAVIASHGIRRNARITPARFMSIFEPVLKSLVEEHESEAFVKYLYRSSA